MIVEWSFWQVGALFLVSVFWANFCDEDEWQFIWCTTDYRVWAPGMLPEILLSFSKSCLKFVLLFSWPHYCTMMMRDNPWAASLQASTAATKVSHCFNHKFIAFIYQMTGVISSDSSHHLDPLPTTITSSSSSSSHDTSRATIMEGWH